MYTDQCTPMILAGGLGTRLRPVISNYPKVLVEVNGRPFLSFLFDQLLEAGFKKVILCTGYMAGQVQQTFGEHYYDLKLVHSPEFVPLGTGGALRNAFPLLKKCPDHVLVMNGDSYIQVKVGKFIDWHFEQKADASMVLSRVENTARYGSVEMDNNSRILDFREKNSGASAGWVNAGVYIFEKTQVERLSPATPISLENDFLPTLLGGEVLGFKCDGAFIDIGTPSSYSKMGAFFVNLKE